MTGMRGPVRIPHSVTYRDADQPKGTCETAEYFGSDLWIIGTPTKTNDDNSEAARLCRSCPKRDTCPAEADRNPAMNTGTIRGAKAYFHPSEPGTPFKLCARLTCHRLFASTKKNQDYCSPTCRQNAEANRARSRKAAA